MELSDLKNNVFELFNVSNTKELSIKIEQIVLNNEFDYYEKFANIVKDLSVDWLQKIFQYYEADRMEKKQDYTPISLAKFVAILSDEKDDIVVDLCAGSGALTIQKWNINKNSKFICKELDENVIPYLLFNLALRNINAEVEHTDVLSGDVFKKYYVIPQEKFSKVEVAK